MSIYNKVVIPLCLLLLLPIAGRAQGRHKAKPKAVAHVNPLFDQMLEGTAKVMFIDSIVVSKDSFLHYIPLNKESGSLSFDDEGRFVYTNEMGTRRLYAATDSAGEGIYTQDKLGNGFVKPSLLSELTDDLVAGSYPFLMSDGVTLFFSAEGAKSMGGRDIFMTRYNANEDEYYAPDNYGLPFNSTANDYLIAIDELDTLGWLVTDRRQPEGRVCVYTFEPTQQRNGFEGDDLSDEELKSYARLTSIEDTWQFGNRDAAMARLNALKARQPKVQHEAEFTFVVNDSRVCHRLSDFRSTKARQLYTQLLDLRKTLADNEALLDKWRNEYRQKPQLASRIQEAEKTLDKQRGDLREFEKKIRNLENNQ